MKAYAGVLRVLAAVATLAKTDEMIYMGVEQNGWLKVESGGGSGWVKKLLVAK